jgi:hypothetical protein
MLSIWNWIEIYGDVGLLKIKPKRAVYLRQWRKTESGNRLL